VAIFVAHNSAIFKLTIITDYKLKFFQPLHWYACLFEKFPPIRLLHIEQITLLDNNNEKYFKKERIYPLDFDATKMCSLKI